MIKRLRVLVATNDRSLVGRDWLLALQYQLKPSNQIKASECISMISDQLAIGAHSSEVDRFE